MNLIQDASQWLNDNLQVAAGRSIVYRRGASVSTTLTAPLSRKEYDTTDNEGFGTTAMMYDFLIEAVDLVVAGKTIIPRPGDQIELGDEVYEVLPPSGDLPCFERFDVSGVTYRVHTKTVG